jgi:hypothetical protein
MFSNGPTGAGYELRRFSYSEGVWSQEPLEDGAEKSPFRFLRKPYQTAKT